jgi:hypothetical protein
MKLRYRIIGKADKGFKFLVYRGKKKIIKKSDYFLSYDDALLAVHAEIKK